jgi:predicted nucleic acid-binding protein
VKSLWSKPSSALASREISGPEADYRAFLTRSPNLTLQPITAVVLEKVIELRAQFGFKTPDAIHLATGLLAGCDLFVTGDQAWSWAGITVVDPADVA